MLRSVVSTLDYVLAEINQIIWRYAVKVEVHPDSLANMYSLSCIECCFVFPYRQKDVYNTFTAWRELLSFQRIMPHGDCGALWMDLL